MTRLLKALANRDQLLRAADLAAANFLKGNMVQAKNELAEARRLNPKLTVRSMPLRYANIPAIADGLRKAGLPEE